LELEYCASSFSFTIMLLKYILISPFLDQNIFPILILSRKGKQT